MLFLYIELTVAIHAVLLGSFAISKLTDLTDQLNALNVLSPFKYFSYERILNGEGLHAGIVALSLLLVVVLVVVTYAAYRKRELNV